jgi:hypothetical protein
MRGIYCGTLLGLKAPDGPSGAAKTFEWTPEGAAWTMNAACLDPE